MSKANSVLFATRSSQQSSDIFTKIFTSRFGLDWLGRLLLLLR